MTGSVAGQFEVRGDSDAFRVRFEAGKTYQISSGNNGPILKLQLPDGTVFDPPVSYSNQITFVAPVTGDYWVTATDYGASQFYSIVANEITDTTPASLATALTLGVGETKAMDWAPDIGSEWFAVTLVAGQSYFFRSSGLNDTLYLNDSNGALITLQDDQLHFTATQSGTYYAGIRSSGAYTISLATIADDRGETAATAGSVAVGGSVGGVWETGNDSDWFAITLTAGSSYSLALTAPNLFGTSLRVFDAAGNLVQNGTSGLVPSSMIFSPEAGGTYYVSAKIGSDYYNPHGNWNYTLTATQLVNDLPGNALTTGVITVGTTKTGSWEGPGDIDWFAVTLNAGQTTQFVATANGQQQIAAFALYDSLGKLVINSLGGSGSVAQLAQTVQATGVYYVGITAGTGAASYSIATATFTDDFANNSSTTGTLTVGGTATGNFEAQGDRDWFAVQLEAGKSYSFTGSTLSLRLIRDAQGNALTRYNDGDNHFSPTTTGIYYLENAGGVGAYTVGITQVADDHREDMLSRGVIRRAVTGDATDEIFTSTIDHDSFNGLGGNDRFVAGAGYDVFFGGQGTDIASFSAFAAGVSISLRLGGLIENGAPRVLFSSIEDLEGSAFDDIIEGNGVANALFGLGGNDMLDGGSGADAMYGGTGSDTYIVDNVGDTVFEVANGNLDTDTINAYVSYTLGAGQEIERLRAGPGSDPINLTGNEFGQKIVGNNGANILTGGGGNDNLSGGDGDDVLIGGTGLDKLTGGAGADRFVFQVGGQMDMIVDFATGVDKLDLTAFGMTWQQVMNAMTEGGGNTIIDLANGDSIRIAGVAKASLSVGDFLLGGSSSGDAPWFDLPQGRVSDGGAHWIDTDSPQLFPPLLSTEIWHGMQDWYLM